jgi:hypothetical protein
MRTHRFLIALSLLPFACKPVGPGGLTGATGATSETSFSTPPTRATTTWASTTIDTFAAPSRATIDLGANAVAIAVVSDKPAIAYLKIPEGQTRYAIQGADGSWTKETVDTTGGGNEAIVVAANGQPIVTYTTTFTATPPSNVYSVRMGQRSVAGSWTVTDIASQYMPLYNSNSDCPTSIALLQSGMTAIGWCARNESVPIRFPRLAMLSGATGPTLDMPVPNGTWSGQGLVYAFDHAAHPRAIYSSYVGVNGPASVEYASYDGSTWTHEQLEPPVTTNAYGAYPRFAIAVDAQDRTHVLFIYPNAGATGLFYGLRDTTGWHIEAVEQSWAGAMTVDQSGTPHLVYQKATEGSLYYAKKVSGAWQAEPMVRDTVQGSINMSLTLSPTGDPWLAIASSQTTALLFIERTHGTAPQGWTCEALYYQDAHCDCGCGIADPDCAMKSCTAAGCAARYSAQNTDCSYCWGIADHSDGGCPLAPSGSTGPTGAH